MSDRRFLQEGFDKQLAHVVEECGEVLAAAGKTQRWGRKSVNPLIPEDAQETNESWLVRELRDLDEAIGRLLATTGHQALGPVPDRRFLCDHDGCNVTAPLNWLCSRHLAERVRDGVPLGSVTLTKDEVEQVMEALETALTDDIRPRSATRPLALAALALLRKPRP